MHHLPPPRLDGEVLDGHPTVEAPCALVPTSSRPPCGDGHGHTAAGGHTGIDSDVPIPSVREADKEVLEVVAGHVHLVKGYGQVTLERLGHELGVDVLALLRESDDHRRAPQVSSSLLYGLRTNRKGGGRGHRGGRPWPQQAGRGGERELGVGAARAGEGPGRSPQVVVLEAAGWA